MKAMMGGVQSDEDQISLPARYERRRKKFWRDGSRRNLEVKMSVSLGVVVWRGMGRSGRIAEPGIVELSDPHEVA